MSGLSGLPFVVGVAALLVVRMCLTAHAPSFVDAHACLAAVSLAFVAGAARHAQIAAVLFAMGVVLSLPGSFDPWISLLALPALLGPLAFFLLASSGSCRHGLLAAAGIGGACNAIAALVQKTITWPAALARIDELGLDPAQAAHLAHARPIGLSLSPDLAGGLCLAGAFCAAALAIEVPSHRRGPRVALALTALVSLSGLAVVRSFGCALALVAGAAVTALLIAARRGRMRALFVAAVGLALGTVVLVGAVMSRGADAVVRSAGERVENWRAAWEVFTDAPWLGVGLMRFGAAYLQVRGPDANVTRYAHSAPLQMLAETGLIGVLLATTALALLGYAIWQRSSSRAPDARWTTCDCLIAGGAAALAVRACIDYDLHVAQSASVFAVLVGLLVARDDPTPAEPAQRRALAALAVLSLALLLVLGVRQGALESEDRATLTRYVDALPFDVEPRIALGAQAVDVLVVCNDNASCVSARANAFAALDPLCERQHPSPVALVLRARAHASIGHLEQALTDVDAALQVDRGNGSAHQLGVALARALTRKDVHERTAAARAWGVSVEEP